MIPAIRIRPAPCSSLVPSCHPGTCTRQPAHQEAKTWRISRVSEADHLRSRLRPARDLDTLLLSAISGSIQQPPVLCRVANARVLLRAAPSARPRYPMGHRPRRPPRLGGRRGALPLPQRASAPPCRERTSATRTSRTDVTRSARAAAQPAAPTGATAQGIPLRARLLVRHPDASRVEPDLLELAGRRVRPELSWLALALAR